MAKRRAKPIIQCRRCRAYIHLERHPICCGYNYASGTVFDRTVPPLTEPEKVKPVKKVRKNKSKRKRVPDELREAVYMRDRYTCQDCHAEKPREGLHAHHIVYVSNGGMNTLDNLVTLCEACHSERHKDEPVYKIMKKRLNNKC